MHKIYISLGSNLGNSYNYIVSALQTINTVSSIKLISVSPFYISNPLAYSTGIIINQKKYINAVAYIKTVLDPMSLLYVLHNIENMHGRIRTIRWGPRTLDLDILLFNNYVINEYNLKIPHYDIYNRPFVLYPLYDIEPNLILPNGDKLMNLLLNCKFKGLHRL